MECLSSFLQWGLFTVAALMFSLVHFYEMYCTYVQYMDGDEELAIKRESLLLLQNLKISFLALQVALQHMWPKEPIARCHRAPSSLTLVIRETYHLPYYLRRKSASSTAALSSRAL